MFSPVQKGYDEPYTGEIFGYKLVLIFKFLKILSKAQNLVFPNIVDT